VEYTAYVERTQRAAHLSQAGEYDEALRILTGLVRSDISDIDKSMMCLNVAVVYDKQGKTELALEWHDRGIAYERLYARAFVAMHKAGYLATLDRVSESLGLFRELAELPYLTEGDKETVRRNIATLEDRGGS
jgi:hypothetical protein